MMTISNSCIVKSIKAFCSNIGSDPLLVQGAGGNISWKEGDILWIKASGTWLAEAETKNIFTPVNLSHLRIEIANKNFSATPEVCNNSDLKPSIETLLHALMPHKVVVHLHAIEILAHLVQANAKEKIKNLIANSFNWSYVPYCKPGAELAEAVFEQLFKNPDSQIVFLENHGVVIGGDDVNEVASTLHSLTLKLQTEPSLEFTNIPLPKPNSELLKKGYIPCSPPEISLLSYRDEMIKRVLHDWALYPDHVVFLGAKPVTTDPSLSHLDQITASQPPFIFVIGDAVYENLNVTDAQKAQLRCYYDVIARQKPSEKLSSLSDRQILELLNWDAEKYRKKTNSNRRELK